MSRTARSTQTTNQGRETDYGQLNTVQSYSYSDDKDGDKGDLVIVKLL